jgi:hypothetical protein
MNVFRLGEKDSNLNKPIQGQLYYQIQNITKTRRCLLVSSAITSQNQLKVKPELQSDCGKFKFFLGQVSGQPPPSRPCKQLIWA